MNQITDKYDDEIDLRELFAALISKWAIIAFFGFISVTLAGYYAFKVATPKYESNAVFAMPNSSGSSMGGLGALAGLAGVSLPTSSGSGNVIDRVAGRDFVVDLADELDLLSDPFFNSTLTPPGMKRRLFTALGISKSEPPTENATESGLVDTFRKSISINSTKAGAYSVTFSHTNPDAAATIANAVVNKVLTQSRNKQIEEQQSRVEYLSEQLFKAQNDLDNATEKVQEFAVVNNLLSVQELLQRSQRLTKMRERRNALASNISTLTKLDSFLDTPENSEEAFDNFLENNERLHDREIALLIGNPTTWEDWFELEEDTILGAVQNFSDQLAQIGRNIATFKAEASATAENAAMLARLERDVKVEAATYEVVVAQFKQQALTSGFELSLGTIYETAVPAIGPSSPNKRLILALGGVLGVFLGSGAALFLSMTHGSVHTRSAVANHLDSRTVYFNRRAFARLEGGNLARLVKRFQKLTAPEVGEFAYSINAQGKTTYLIVPPTQSAATPLTALALSKSADLGNGTLVIDLFSQLKITCDNDAAQTVGGYKVCTTSVGFNIATPTTHDVVSPQNFAHSELTKALQTLKSGYKSTFILTKPVDDAGYILKGLQKLDPLVISSGKLGNITSGSLQRLNSLLPEGDGTSKRLLFIC